MKIERHELLTLMQHHIGIERATTVERLVKEFHDRFDRKCTARDLRAMVQELRMEGQHICAHPRCGYFMAATPSELDETCEFLRQRALSSLMQISAMKRVSLPDLVGQKRFLLGSTS